MNRYVTVIVVTLAASFAVLNGVLMLALPNTHIRFLAWLGRTAHQSERFGSVRKVGPQLQRRLAGLCLTAMGGYFIWLVWNG